jgi:hypothetical protein
MGTEARFSSGFTGNGLAGLTFDPVNQVLYLADAGNNLIRRITTSGGMTIVLMYVFVCLSVVTHFGPIHDSHFTLLHQL